ncbi:unnamed protein product [Mytilus coruscus]|uniref:Reverse transcriptase domain-containing protein n=1 Tax=Mytilus coruscus TaxID=42192 RepID=A0A6J8EBQ9_MYTCO|nr:unnamed protein product [Mytilus coruscus]
MASALPVFPPFSVHESAADQRRKKWTKRLQNLLVGMNIKDKVRQRALLLHYAGDTYNRMKRKPKLIATKTKVFAYGSHQNLDFVGKFDTVIETRDKLTNATIIPQISRLSTGNKYELLCEQYKDIFHGLGKLKDTQVKIHIDNTVKPIVQPHRRIPFHVRKQVEAELERLERLDIIERVHGPTPWVSPIVVAPKPRSPGEIRIGVDMRLPNQAIQRERHITPTIDDLIVDLNGANVFSKMDLLNGYHQLELTQES